MNHLQCSQVPSRKTGVPIFFLWNLIHWGGADLPCSQHPIPPRHEQERRHGRDETGRDWDTCNLNSKQKQEQRSFWIPVQLLKGLSPGFQEPNFADRVTDPAPSPRDLAEPQDEA